MCPHCKRPAVAVIQGRAQWSGQDDEGEIVAPPSEWNLLQCNLCKVPSLELREDFSGEGFEHGAVSYEYPAPRRLSYSVPTGLRRSWEEAQRCFEANAYTAAVVMVRRTLEGTCAELGMKNQTLAKSLIRLRADGVIDGTLAEWADALRVVGNIGAHYTETDVTRQDAEDALAFAEAFLDHVYVLRQRFEKFKERL
jgi:Domain of unknown function (DUF4145)